MDGPCRLFRHFFDSGLNPRTQVGACFKGRMSDANHSSSNSKPLPPALCAPGRQEPRANDDGFLFETVWTLIKKFPNPRASGGFSSTFPASDPQVGIDTAGAKEPDDLPLSLQRGVGSRPAAAGVVHGEMKRR